MSFLIGISHKTRTFCHLLALLGSFADPNVRFPYPFTSTSEIPYLFTMFTYLKPEKRTPFRRNLPVKAIIRSAPRGLMYDAL